MPVVTVEQVVRFRIDALAILNDLSSDLKAAQNTIEEIINHGTVDQS